jgi:hypothetical protein
MGHQLVGDWVGLLVGWVVKCWDTMGYSVPEAESAPQFFLRSYPQAYPQAGQGVGVCLSDRSRAPPLVELRGGK